MRTKQPSYILFDWQAFIDLLSLLGHLRTGKHPVNAKGFAKGSNQIHSSRERGKPIKALAENSYGVVLKLSCGQPSHEVSIIAWKLMPQRILINSFGKLLVFNNIVFGFS